MRKPNYDEQGQKDFCEVIAKHFGTDVVDSKQINEFIKLKDLPFPHFLINNKSRSAGWGKYRVMDNLASPVSTGTVVSLQAVAVKKPTLMSSCLEADSFIPEKDPTFVPFGFFEDLKNIIDSKIFFPIYITGLSGNGKTLMVIQVCSNLKREMVRVNITKETDELDLFGSFELVNGNTIYREGPVITAMKRGAVLLLDETDYGSERLLCLQPVLEGKPVLNKKTGEIVHPQPGFNVLATANTKGKGSNDGRFIGANILNEAFLERFAITVEQEYPSPQKETQMLQKNFKELGLDLEKHGSFVTALIKWAELVRKSFADGAVDEIISTRRLVHITKAYSIFENRKKAVRLCLNRFDDETRTAIMDLYEKIDVEDDDKKKKQDTTTPSVDSLTGIPQQSDIEYVPTAAKMTNSYKMAVVLKNETDKGKPVLAVYSHGRKTSKQIGELPSPTQVRLFEEAVKKLVEYNSLAEIPF
jgi:MoxR-like ATPase